VEPATFSHPTKVFRTEYNILGKKFYPQKAPKMKAKKVESRSGCSSCNSFTRSEEPWERADGSIMILAELGKIIF
jgi:hypothetical protein